MFLPFAISSEIWERKFFRDFVGMSLTLGRREIFCQGIWAKGMPAACIISSLFFRASASRLNSSWSWKVSLVLRPVMAAVEPRRLVINFVHSMDE